MASDIVPGAPDAPHGGNGEDLSGRASAQDECGDDAIGKAARPTTRQLGATAESGAAEFLVAQGYRIIERNFRSKIGELDIIAYDGKVLCFVEVRSRGNDRCGDAAMTVTAAKQRQVTRAAHSYLCSRRVKFEQARFDVVAVTSGQVTLIRDAWRLSRW